MLETFMRPKPSKVLILLRDTDSNWHLSKLAKNSGSTYVYVKGLIEKLEKAGLVTTESKGKKRLVKLTQVGTAVAATMFELTAKLESIKTEPEGSTKQ
ncbi:hypothetical protein HY990_00720 [Candidatus Micrarchaeota archaeon]|nr:hypothetical protein [Candidatus Micrarchaeota archaeon]